MVESFITLEPANFQQLAAGGFFRAVVDVRRMDEWTLGHLENATLMESLQVTQNISKLADCERSCPIALYCRTGRRSKLAAQVLEANGFVAVYDILGVSQLTAAGVALVHSPSMDPSCSASVCYSPPLAPPPDQTWVIITATSLSTLLAISLLAWYLWCRRLSRAGGSSGAQDGSSQSSTAAPATKASA